MAITKSLLAKRPPLLYTPLSHYPTLYHLAGCGPDPTGSLVVRTGEGGLPLNSPPSPNTPRMRAHHTPRAQPKVTSEWQVDVKARAFAGR